MCDECRAETTQVLASPEKRTLHMGLQKAWNKVHGSMPVGMLRHPREKGDEDEEEPSRKRARTVRDEEAEELAANLDMGEGSLVAIETADRARPPAEKDLFAPFVSKIVDLPLIRGWAQEIRNQFPGSPIALRIFWMELFKHFFDFSVRASPIDNPNATWEDWARAFEHAYHRRGYPMEIMNPLQWVPPNISLIQQLALRYGIRGTIYQKLGTVPVYLLRTRNALVSIDGRVGVFRYTRPMGLDEYRMWTTSDEFLEINECFVICWSNEPIQQAEELEQLTDFTFYAHQFDEDDTIMTDVLPDGTILKDASVHEFDDPIIRIIPFFVGNDTIGVRIEWTDLHTHEHHSKYNTFEGRNQWNLPVSLSMYLFPESFGYEEAYPMKYDEEEEEEAEVPPLDAYFLDADTRQLRYENNNQEWNVGTAPFRDATETKTTLTAVDAEGKVYVLSLERSLVAWRQNNHVPRPLPWPVISATVISQPTGTGPSMIPVYITTDRELIIGDQDINDDEKDERIQWIYRKDRRFYIPTHFKQQNMTRQWGRRFLLVRTLGDASLFLVDEDGEMQVFGPDGYHASDQIQMDVETSGARFRKKKEINADQVLAAYEDLLKRPYLLRFGTVRKGIYLTTIEPSFPSIFSVLIF